MVEDVDNYYKAIKEKGAKIIAVPQSKEWNIKEMLVEDPDVHILKFGHQIECG